MGRPRRSRNSPVRILTKARVLRWRRGLSLHAVCSLTAIPADVLSRIERGELPPSDADRLALARLYDTEPDTLLLDVETAVAS
jgi:transcriptional regulator with XRE-family HTH domain